MTNQNRLSNWRLATVGACSRASPVPRPLKASITMPTDMTSEATPTCSLLRKFSTARMVAKSMTLARMVAPPSQLKPRRRWR
nr:hypothetical protein [Azospirillum sp. B4]